MSRYLDGKCAGRYHLSEDSGKRHRARATDRLRTPRDPVPSRRYLPSRTLCPWIANPGISDRSSVCSNPSLHRLHSHEKGPQQRPQRGKTTYPVSTGTWPSGRSNMTVFAWPPALSSASRTVTSTPSHAERCQAAPAWRGRNEHPTMGQSAPGKRGPSQTIGLSWKRYALQPRTPPDHVP